MFKSLFAKYMTAFMLIILISFAILAAVISGSVRSYTIEYRERIMAQTARTAELYLSQTFSDSEIEDFSQFIYYNSRAASEYLTLLTDYAADTTIFVSNAAGDILLSDINSPISAGEAISPHVVEDILDGNSRQQNNLGGLFGDCHLTYAKTIESDTDILGIVYTSASSAKINLLVDNLVKTIIMTFLWISLATLIAVYFISDKIISPLKDMSKAARSFASGNFDVRVPVIGQDEVAELATAFNNMAGSLNNIEDSRRAFLANISHDLRTPMTTISGFVDNIIDGVIPQEKQEHYLRIVSSETKRLSRLVQQLLDISRIESGVRKFNMTVFDICEMARQILISFETKIDEKKLEVEFSADSDNMYVSADRDAIYQIFYNIADNGIKFSYEGGKYRVTIIQKEKRYMSRFITKGCGNSREDIPYVFDRFYKGDKSRGIDKSGVGLGMYISKTIIDAHHEEIWVKSVYGEYCEFVFTLSPAKTPPHKKTDEQADILQ